MTATAAPERQPPLLSTKLFVPHTRQTIVPRPRLPLQVLPPEGHDDVVEADSPRPVALEEVVVTGWGREAGWLAGRTPCHRIVHFPGGATPGRPGEIVAVRIERALAHSLLGSEPLPAGLSAAPRPPWSGASLASPPRP